MELTSLNILNLNPKEVLKRKTDTSAPAQATVTSIKSDSTSFSKIATQKAPVENSVNHKLAGLGEKLCNQPILDHYKSYRNDPSYKPIIEQVDKAIKSGAGVKDLEKVAVKAVQAQDKSLDAGHTLAKAYRAIMSSVITNHYSDPNFFNGEKDKIFHYFTSSSITVDAYNKIPLLPSSIKENMAGGGVITIGWLKEVASIPGSGYGADDMQANAAGIKETKANIEKLIKDKTL